MNSKLLPGVRQHLNYRGDNDHNYGGHRGSNRYGGGGEGQRSNFRNSYGQNQNPYQWVAPGSQSGGRDGSDSKTVLEMTPQEIVPIISTEIQVWEESNMWPLSCFAYGKEVRCYPGFTDHSLEEVRYKAYEAEKANKFEEFKQQFAHLICEVKRTRLKLKEPDLTTKQKMYDIIEDLNRESRSGGNAALASLGFQPLSSTSSVFGGNHTGSGSVFGNTTDPQSSVFRGSSSQTGSVFGGTPSTQGVSLFGTANQTGSVFGGTPATHTGSIFGGSQARQSGSVFSGSQATQSENVLGGSEAKTSSVFGGLQSSQSGTVFGGTPATQTGSVFGGTQTTTGSIFGGASALQSTSVFGSSQPAQNMASPSLFGKTQPSTQSTTHTSSGGLFGKPVATTSITFSGINSSAPDQRGTRSVVYTPLDSLTKEERAQFEAPMFILGRIPTKPPPRELV